MKKEVQQGVTVKKSENFSEWYTQSILKADLIDYGPVSGCLIFKPGSYSLWEGAQEYFDKKIKKDGVKNVYFPLLIPEKLLKKESDHVEGFAPEVAWVTQTGDTKLNEKLAIRPTSETIMYDSYSKWIRSWKDLPLRYNQWCNVVRWEFKHAVPFLRTREFLWQEGHTVFATKKEADKEAKKILGFYADVYEDLYAVPVLRGIKSEKEKFAGADYSLSVETLLPNGKAIQGATSHHLGQNFSKPFNIKFIGEDEKPQYAWQNSWGFSTRSLGVMLAIHGDDKGLVLPPKIATNKIVVVPILFKNKSEKVMKFSKDIFKKLKKFSPIFDDREDYSAGWKFNEWELKGIPLRLEVGPKDVEKKQVVLVRRDTGEKEFVKVGKVVDRITSLLVEIQKDMFEKAKKYLDRSIISVDSIKKLKDVVEEGWIGKVEWCGNVKCEANIKDKTSAKSLNSSFDEKPKTGKCFACEAEAKFVTYFAKSY
ncbi:proline--tRNA ligase [Candidatus Woesearchaeota archaeon]|jgi:prolyl-tRNA synthetase|nr:proline--tRNA ligase [Candidatus Woesearchaeota archaeon]MBT7238105.1 proline--tRNA ligase [Candidatus Woesearchaeota archaeon]